MITDKAEKHHKKRLFLKVLGVKINAISLKKALSLVERWVKTNKQYQIVTPNPEQVILTQKDRYFAKALNEADLAIADGAGIVWVAKRQNVKLERLSGTDLMLALCKIASKKKWRVFLLGGRKAAEKAAGKLSAGLKIKSHPGSKNIKQESLSERRQIIKAINDFKPHLLFVAYGAPWQELWIKKNLSKLKVKVAMGVGGAFDYISGKTPRAPGFVRNLGLEWLFRLIVEPWRLKRQLVLLKFIYLVIKTSYFS